jgi:hypothetical protein
VVVSFSFCLVDDARFLKQVWHAKRRLNHMISHVRAASHHLHVHTNKGGGGGGGAGWRTVAHASS